MVAPTKTKSPAPKAEILATAEEFAEMAELGRAELLEGRIIEMPPPKDRHGAVENTFSFFITAFVREQKLGAVRVGESGVLIRRNPDTVRGMDIAFISHERLAQQKNREGYLDVAPDLIVEILSPTDRWNAVMQKLREYLAFGVRLVWIADPEARLVYAYRSPTDVREFEEGDELLGDDVLPGFRVPVASLFEE